MMRAFAIWVVSHILIYPVAKNILLYGAMIVLALAEAALQDRKKAALDPHGWPAWEARTSYLPFAAIAAGRATFGGFGIHARGGGVAVWLAARHLAVAGLRLVLPDRDERCRPDAICACAAGSVCLQPAHSELRSREPVGAPRGMKQENGASTGSA